MSAASMKMAAFAGLISFDKIMAIGRYFKRSRCCKIERDYVIHRRTFGSRLLVSRHEHHRGSNVVRAYPRERFSREVALSPAVVVEFAKAAGDNNPIHHDPEFAATTRFGRPTASGPHATALLLALTASPFFEERSNVGS